MLPTLQRSLRQMRHLRDVVKSYAKLRLYRLYIEKRMLTKGLYFFNEFLLSIVLMLKSIVFKVSRYQ